MRAAPAISIDDALTDRNLLGAALDDLGSWSTWRVGLLAQVRLEASARTSFVFCLGVIELDVGAMECSRSFVAIKQNAERCAATSATGVNDYYPSANSDLWATRGTQFV
jgi:hypothetical protein